MNSSQTVKTLLIEVRGLQKTVDELRSILLDAVKQQIVISQIQAEANSRFLALVEAQAELMQAYTKFGPGTSRSRSEDEEAAAWRAELESATRKDTANE